IVLTIVPAELNAASALAAYSVTQRLPSAPGNAPIGADVFEVVGYSVMPAPPDNSQRRSRRKTSRSTLARLGRGRLSRRRRQLAAKTFRFMVNLGSRCKGEDARAHPSGLDDANGGVDHLHRLSVPRRAAG